MTADSESKRDLVLVNFETRIRGRQSPQTGGAIRVSRGRIHRPGAQETDHSFVEAGARVIDCQGLPLLPGFTDAHCHVMAYASSLTAVDCGPSAVSSIAAIKGAIRCRTASTPEGQWIRASGYSDFDLADKRHPTRWDLDEVSPRHPVRLTHRSGHALVLNTMALYTVGITNAMDEPPGGTVDREPLGGEPTGLLLEMNDFVRSRMSRLTDDELRSAVRMVSDKFLSYGVTSVCDASPGNTPERYQLFKDMQRGGHFLPPVTMMAGANFLDSFISSGLIAGQGDSHLNVGHAKIMLTMSSGRLSPSVSELLELINRAHSSGFPVAIHAVEAEALEAAVEALEAAMPLPNGNWMDRIEHCSECPDRLLPRLARLRVAVVTNPGFLYFSGDRYLAKTPEERTSWLYRMRSLIEAGIPLVVGSDAPVIDPNPMTGIYSAITRHSAGGKPVNADEGLSLDQAISVYSRRLDSEGTDSFQASYVGDNCPANLVLLDRRLDEDYPKGILKAKVAMTILNGEVVYEA